MNIACYICKKYNVEIRFVDERDEEDAFSSSNGYKGYMNMCVECAKTRKKNGWLHNKHGKYCCAICGTKSSAVASDKWNDEQAHQTCYAYDPVLTLCYTCHKDWHYNK